MFDVAFLITFSCNKRKKRSIFARKTGKMRPAANKYQDKHQNEVISFTSGTHFFTLFLQKRCQVDSSEFRSAHDISPYNHPFTFTGKEKDAETGFSYFGARYYDSDLSGLFLSIDPMADKYPSLSPYVYCAWNPVKLVDPDGNEVNPIFSTEGNLLGTDNKGYSGRAIVLEESSFRQGMNHKEAESKGTYLDEYGSSISISDRDWNKVVANGGERQKPYLSNKTDERVFFKPDKSQNIFSDKEAYPCEPHMDIYMPIDGIKTAEMGRNEVFKVVDKTRVTIQPNRCIPYTFGSNRYSPRFTISIQPSGNLFEIITGFAGNIKAGGLLKNAPDSGWNALRDVFVKQ